MAQETPNDNPTLAAGGVRRAEQIGGEQNSSSPRESGRSSRQALEVAFDRTVKRPIGQVPPRHPFRFRVAFGSVIAHFPERTAVLWEDGTEGSLDYWNRVEVPWTPLPLPEAE